MKKTKFITTFSKTGYEVYGRTWIESFLANVKDENITADVYVDFPINIESDRINLINYNLAIPQHLNWIKEFNETYRGLAYNKTMAVRFSYKSFVMMHALQNNHDCYIIWLDGDCVYQSDQTYSDFAKLVLNNKFIVVQREHNGGDDHCESGVVVFDADHADKNKFLTQFQNNYKIENIVQMGSPYDGFIIYRSLRDIDYVDLNDGYGRGGIQSDPNETFLHPELKKRFIHNIGITGKSSYESWSNYALTDKYFKMLRGGKKTPEEIKSIRQMLIEKRRNGL